MSKNRTQKILIPKGTVDPNEDTLIEIPANMQELPIVVAKKPGSEQNLVSLERYSKNIEVEDRSSIRIKENDKTYPPRHPGSLRNLQENTTQNDSMRNTVIENKLEDLNGTAFMTAMSSNLESFSAFEKGLREPKSISSYQHNSVHSQKPIGSASSRLSQLSCRTNQDSSAIGINETLEKSKRTSSTCTACTVSCKKSQQSMTLKPQDSEGAPIDLTSSNKDAPFCSFSKRSEASVSFNVIPQNTVEKEVSQREDKAQSAVCLSHLFFKKPCQTSSNKRLREDKEVHSDSSEFEEKESRHYHVSRGKKKSKCSCRDNESSSTEEDNSGDRKEKIKKMYKYSENVFDNIYVEQLKRQFADAKRKLEEAVKLASITLKEMECRKCPVTCIEPRSSSSAVSICDSVPERDVSFIPSSSSSHRCRVSVPDLNENPSRTLNRKENSWQKVESGRSDIYKNYEIYENIRTKRYDDNQMPKSKLQQDTDSDSPCPFLKIPNPDIPSPRLCRLSKDRDTQTEQKSSIDRNSSIDTKITTKGEKAEGEKKRMELGNRKCSSTCVKTQSGNSLKFVKPPRGNCSDTDSLVEKKSPSRKMNN